MNTNDKQQIREAMMNHISASGISDRAFANKADVSPATVSQIRRNNIELISDKMWMTIATAAGFRFNKWQTAKTSNLQLIHNTLKICQDEGMVFALAADAGSGKTTACEDYARNHENVIYLRCRESWNRKMFHTAMVQACGIDPSGYTTYELVGVMIKALQSKPGALVIWDEADKLRDKIILFIELYNELKGRVGFFLCGTPRFRLAIERGAKRDRLGFNEIHSRLGRNFLNLNKNSKNDIHAICHANGVTDPQTVDAIFQDFLRFDDLRRAELLINRHAKRGPVNATES